MQWGIDEPGIESASYSTVLDERGYREKRGIKITSKPIKWDILIEPKESDLLYIQFPTQDA